MRAWCGVDAEHRHIDCAARVARARAVGELAVLHQRAVEPAVRAAAENMCKHIKRFLLARLGAVVRWREIRALHAGLSPPIRERHMAHRGRWRLLRAFARTNLS